VRFQEQEITSVSDLIGKLAKDMEGIKSPLWFRGQSMKDWHLTPSIFRGNHDSEINMIKKFKQDATLLVNPRPTQQIEWLFIMRHHNIPTRLLDWTESPLVALYFATRTNDPSDGALWVLLPVELNKQGNRALPDPEDLPSFEEDAFMAIYTPETYVADKLTEMLPIAFLAPRNNVRMQVQLSVFTLSHRNRTSIEEIGNHQHVWRYIISAAAKPLVRKELEMLRIGRFQLFPELESISDRFRRY
jgi:hypothetical protein